MGWIWLVLGAAAYAFLKLGPFQRLLAWKRRRDRDRFIEEVVVSLDGLEDAWKAFRRDLRRLAADPQDRPALAQARRSGAAVAEAERTTGKVKRDSPADASTRPVLEISMSSAEYSAIRSVVEGMVQDALRGIPPGA